MTKPWCDGDTFFYFILRLTSGYQNTLFHYLLMDGRDGIYICPAQQEMRQVSSPTHNVVMKQFNAACLQIHRLFEQSALKEVGASCLVLSLSLSFYQLGASAFYTFPIAQFMVHYFVLPIDATLCVADTAGFGVLLILEKLYCIVL